MAERILVCGGRNYNDMEMVERVLGAHDISVLIHGGASGADRLASLFAFHREIEQIEFKALWAKHGRAAGPIRNQQMLDVGRPTKVIAFPGGRGTADMIRRAKESGVPVYEVNHPEASHG